MDLNGLDLSDLSRVPLCLAQVSFHAGIIGGKDLPGIVGLAENMASFSYLPFPFSLFRWPCGI